MGKARSKPKSAATVYPSFDLAGRVALVTGAARGLGRACSLALAHAGADLALGFKDVHSDSGLVREIEAMGRRALPLQLDIGRLGEIRAAVRAAHRHFGRIDILVNNAGVAIVDKAEDVTEENFDRCLAVNLKGTFFMSQAVGKIMIKQKSGRIINLSSQAGLVALAGESVYCMTKAGISHLTKCLAIEWGKHKVNVNAVAPTFIRTPGTKKALADKAFKAQTLENIAALHRIGEPSDVTGAVIYLAAPASALVTGTTLLVDGGWTAR